MNFTASTPSANVSQLASTALAPPGATDEPQWAIIVRWIIGCVIIIVGSVGNIMVCAVVYKNQRMQTAMNLFLVNLAAWDVLVCLFNIPFTLIYVQMKSWPFGLFWCKAMPTLQVMNLSASTGSLLAITVERFRAICHPLTPPLSRFQAKLTIVVVSLASFLVALPEVGAYELIEPFGCGEHFPTKELRKAYSLLLFLACYLIPLVIIVPAYTIMIYKLWRTDNEDNTPSSGVSEDPKNRKRKRNVLKMMAIVVTCYAICMMPNYALFIWLDWGLKGAPPSYFLTLLSYAQLLSFFNSCINPIIYWFLSEQFTKGFKKILRCNKFNSWTRQHSSTTSSEPNPPNVNTVPTRV